MRFQITFLFICLWMCAAFPVQGQSLQDTIQEIHIRAAQPQDTVTDLRNQFTAGQQRQQLEKEYLSLYKTQSVAQLLSQQTPVFVKSYGINGMATLTFRGASAAQSAVLWNGIPVLNPALGVADISLLNTGLFDQVGLQYGSSAALYGSGNVGGALVLDNNNPVFQKASEVSMTIGGGSFGRRDGAGKISWQNEKWRVGIQGFYQQIRNNFSYLDIQNEEKTLDNAQLKAGGALFTADYNLSKNKNISSTERLSFQLWLQQYNRQIPPALFEAYSVKEQQDASLRSLVYWQKATKRSHYYAKASYNREFLHYQDNVTYQNNKNTVAQYYQEIGWKWRMDNPEKYISGRDRSEHYVLLFAPIQYAEATGDNINGKERQFRPAVVFTYQLITFNNRLKLNTAFRQEWLNGTMTPLLPGAGFSFRALAKEKVLSGYSLTLLANVQRTYRIPTLNELYYFPGGNINLKPEQGWSQDGGYVFVYKQGKNKHTAEISGTDRLAISHELVVFHRKISDWIYWLGGAIWTPYNIAEVRSRGIETDNKISYRVGKAKLHFSGKWAYLLSTSLSSYLPGDGSIGKQIPYTPRYNGQANLGITWNNVFINYNQTYTGYRFITIDESQYLKPYSTGNLQAMYSLNKLDYNLRIAFQLQNITNERYEVVNGRPMPGRYFIASLQVGWKK